MRYATILLFCSAAFAQTGQTEMLSGKVADEFGESVSGASVQAKDAAGKQFKATSAATGEYTIDKLPPGVYEITVTAATMKNFVKKDFAVSGTEAARLDVKLAAANLSTLGEDDRLTTAAYRQIGSTPPSGPAPRLPDGKPDLSGFWAQQRAGGPPDASQERAEPLPWAEAIQRERLTSLMRDIPSSRCLPNGMPRVGKFVHNASMLVILNSTGREPARQIFLDGRGHPKDPNPTWIGDSVGHWEGDTLVVDTVGFNGLIWPNTDGLPATEMLHITERFHRTDLGHLETETTFEDPPVLRKPWTQKRVLNLDPKEDVEEDVCENNKDLQHLLGK
jgi:hypothetical protein